MVGESRWGGVGMGRGGGVLSGFQLLLFMLASTVFAVVVTIIVNAVLVTAVIISV